MILSCKSITKSFGATPVLRNVSFAIDDGEKAALVGVNGAGKTTLLNILTGGVEPDGGELSLRGGASIGFLSQMTDLDPAATIHEELLSVFAPLKQLEAELREAERNMAGLSEAAMARYTDQMAAFERKGGYEYESRARGVLSGLGFRADELALPVSRLSGGQKTRVALGKLLLNAPDLLLLDEPTNHLDIPSVMWLEDTFLRGFPGAVLVVSHDRYFLDKFAVKVIDLERGVSSVYNGNYTAFAYQKETEREVRLKQYLDQQKEIKRQEETIRLLRSYNREKSVKRAESREKLLAKLERVDKPQGQPRRVHIEFEPRITSGQDVLTLRNVSKSFGSRELFKGVSFELKRGQIAAMVGPNGVGKSTLFNMLLKGAAGVKLGENVKIGWFDQEYATLSPNKTVYEEVADAYPRLTVQEVRDTLAAFVFTGDEAHKPVGDLSGGEKGRVLLAKLMLGGANLLLLDEPTNHLDLFSKEILEEALRNYTGTALYISHDRYFINNTAELVIELTPTGANTYLGSYDDYAAKRLSQPGAEQEEKPQTAAAAGRAAQKAKQAAGRKQQARIERIEQGIAAAEAEISRLDALLAAPEVYSDHERVNEIFDEKTRSETQLERLYADYDAALDEFGEPQ